MEYNKVEIETCNVSKITFGNIPKAIVGINIEINRIYSLLFISLIIAILEE
jgi:hypothetical protein